MSFYLLPDLASYARCFETLHFLGFVCNGLFPTIVCNFVVYFFFAGWGNYCAYVCGCEHDSLYFDCFWLMIEKKKSHEYFKFYPFFMNSIPN